MKKSKPIDFAQVDAEFDSILDRLARKITKQGPWHPAYEAVVNPSKRDRPPKKIKPRKSVLSRAKKVSLETTAYLLSSPANVRRLRNSFAQAKKR